MLSLIFCMPELTGSVPDGSALGPCVCSDSGGGADGEIWLLSAAKWMEVKVQSGSHGVMLSGRWEDKHVLKGGDERETDEGGVVVGGGVLWVKQQNSGRKLQLGQRSW